MDVRTDPIADRGRRSNLRKILRNSLSLGLMLVFAGTVSRSSEAQTVLTESTWGGPESDVGRALAVGSDGSSFLAGGTRSFGTSDLIVFLLRFDANGSLVWQRTWDGPSPFFPDDVARVDVAPDGSIYVGGQTLGVGSDALLLKFATDGSLVWQRTYGTSTGEFGGHVAVASDGSIYLVGSTRSSDPNSTDMFIAKFAADGTLVWQKTWGTTDSPEDATGVAVGADGSIYVAGSTPSTTVQFASDIALLKLDPAGTLLWQRTYGAGDGVDARGGVDVASDGSVYVAGGFFDPRTSDLNTLLVKFAADGTFLFDRLWGGRSGDSPEDVTVDATGTVLVAGQTNSFSVGNDDAFILRFQPDGRVIDAQTWGSANLDVGHGVDVAPGGTVSLGATVEAPPPYTFQRAPSKTSRIRRPTIATPTVPLVNGTGTIADAGGVLGTPNGSTTYAGGFDAALVRIEYPGQALASEAGNGDLVGELELERIESISAAPVVARRISVVPNPALHSARVLFSVPADASGRPLSAMIFDVAGRRVRSLVPEFATSGAAEVTWNLENDAGARVSKGLYFIRVGAASGKQVVARIIVAE